jgi:hypothetical protein
MRTSLLNWSLSLSLLTALPACAPMPEDVGDDDAEVDWDGDGKADGWSTGLNEDNLNGLWTATLDGVAQSDDVVIESWAAIGIKLHLGQNVYSLTRAGTNLTGDKAQLALQANKSGVTDDSIDGTLDGHHLTLKRDVAPQAPITLNLPGDRPYRSFLNDLLIPAAQRDRESYSVFHASEVGKWLATCELYKHGSWPRQYMKGDTLSAQYLSFRNVIGAVDNIKASPHALIHNGKFVAAMQSNLKDQSKAALAMSTFTMYFATAAGHSVHIPITPDSMAYFITDRPSRAEKIGVVAMGTPLHGPLASTFGRQLLDFGAMPPADTATYARTMMEMLVKSDAHRATDLSATGRSALTDWFAVMAIEDYRGVAFGYPGLGWGYNMTNVQLYGLVTRALGGQVIVGSELRPGDASYADVLNHGNDMQEYPDMAQLKTLATQYLREQHPDAVAAVETAFAGVVPKNEADWRAQNDIFHFITSQLYDNQGRTASLKGAIADRAIESTVALIDRLEKNAPAFEAYILAHGITKSSTPAPKSTGF